jgi:hypothetical protein
MKQRLAIGATDHRSAGRQAATEGDDRADNRQIAARVQTAGMSMLTIAQIDQKIRTAQEGLARAGDAYDRNIYTQIQNEYEAYRKARMDADLKQSSQRP